MPLRVPAFFLKIRLVRWGKNELMKKFFCCQGSMNIYIFNTLTSVVPCLNNCSQKEISTFNIEKISKKMLQKRSPCFNKTILRAKKIFLISIIN